MHRLDPLEAGHDRRSCSAAMTIRVKPLSPGAEAELVRADVQKEDDVRTLVDKAVATRMPPSRTS
jgi:hypothetical protein